MRKFGEALIEMANGNWLSYIGQTKGQKGVGFLVNKSIKHQIDVIKGISERLAVLTLTTGRQKICIIQVYAPTENSSEEETERFYADLEDTLTEYRSDANLIIGDFNSKIGKKEDNSENAVGPYGVGVRSNKGRRLVQFAESHNLKIANSFFRKNEDSKWTWESPDCKTKNEIDFILTDQLKQVEKLTVINGLKFESDHRMVRASIRVSKRSRRKMMKNKRIHVKTNNKEEFKRILQENLIEYNCLEGNIQEKYNALEKCILKAGDKTRNQGTSKRNKLSTSTLELLDKREEIKVHRNETPEKKLEYEELNKITKKAIRTDLRDYNTNLVRTIMETTKSTKAVKKEIYQGKNLITGAEHPAGRKTVSRKGIVDAATEFYKELYRTTLADLDRQLETYTNMDVDEEVPPILDSEIRVALKELKKGKTPGEDCITNECLQMSEELITKPLRDIFNEIIRTERIPDQWKVNSIILLHKKGAKDDLSNYRPISLLSNIYKLLSKILTRRMTRVLDDNQTPEQAGFRAGYSTADHLQAVCQILEKSQEYNLNLYVAFVDFAKAFDCIEHPCILEALLNQGIQRKYVRLLGKIYSNSYAKIKMDKEGAPFKLLRGVKQGDPLSPKLFNCLLEETFRKLDWRDYGIEINGTRLTNLRFADDIVLFAHTAAEITAMLNELQNLCRKVGLLINLKKTKIMTNDREIQVQVDSQTIDYVQEYVYLGQSVSFRDSSQKEVTRRISLAWKKFWSLSFILMDRAQKLDIKRDILDSCILPVLLYGAQTWTLTQQQMKPIQTTQRKMERKILHISLRDRVKNTTIRERTQVKDAAHSAQILKWKWAGHVIRLNPDRWAHITTVWEPRKGERRPGRPNTRWADEMKKHAGSLWTRTAQNRIEWRRHEENYKIASV